MASLPLALGAATLVAFAAIIGLGSYGEVLVRDVPFLFLHTEFLTKGVILLSVAVIGWATLAPNRSDVAKARLSSMAMLTAGLGLLVTVVAFITPDMVNAGETKPDMFKVEAPTHAQDLMPIAFGLLAATVATARAGRRPTGA